MVKVLLDYCNIKVGELKRELDLTSSPSISAWVSLDLESLPIKPHWPTDSKTRFRRLVVVETPEPSAGITNKGLAFQQLFRLLALMPLHDIEYNSVCTPLLTTGQQQQLPADLFPAVLNAVENGFCHLPDLNRFLIIDLKKEALQSLSEQIDDRLHRTDLQKMVLSIDKRYKPLINRLMKSIKSFQDKNQRFLDKEDQITQSLAVWHDELKAQQVTPVTLGSSARVFLEALLQKHLGAEQRFQSPYQMVKRLQNETMISSWSANALHTIRIFGNWMCHAQPTVEVEEKHLQPVNEDDIMIILLALRRVLDDYPWPARKRTPVIKRRKKRSQKKSKGAIEGPKESGTRNL